MLNEQKVIGNLAADARIKAIGNDRAVVNFRVGSTHRVVSKDHPAKEHTEWFNARVFCSVSAADKFFAQRLTKGSQVYFSGRTITESYKTHEGNDATSVVIECEPRNVVPLSNGKTSKDAGANEGRQSSSAASSQHDIGNRGHSNTVPNGNRMDLMNFD